MKYLFFTILVLPIILLLYTASTRGEEYKLGTVTCAQIKEYLPIYLNSTLEERRSKAKTITKEQIRFILKCLKDKK